MTAFGIISFILAIIGAITGIVGIIISSRGIKPKIQVQGEGTGSLKRLMDSEDFMFTHISFYNNPSILGIRIKREPAEIIESRIYDPDLKIFVGSNLEWSTEGKETTSTITIQPGKKGKLYIFGKKRWDEEYFIIQSNSQEVIPKGPNGKYKDMMKFFELYLRDSHQRTYRFKLIARNFDQSVKTEIVYSRLRRFQFRISYLIDALTG